MNEITIKEKQVVYDLSTEYCSDLKGENCPAKITGIKKSNGRITILPEHKAYNKCFVFDDSDPDKVIAVARLMMGFAQMAKDANNNR